MTADCLLKMLNYLKVDLVDVLEPSIFLATVDLIELYSSNMAQKKLCAESFQALGLP